MPTDLSGTVFISYSRSHSLNQAKALYQALVAESVPAFMDEAAIEPGQAWLKRLEEGLANCSRFVVLVGPEGLNRWVGGEVATILTRCFGAHNPEDRPEIYPVLMGDTPPSVLGGWLSQFQAVHWPNEQAESTVPEALLQALRQGAERTAPAAEPRFAGRNPFVGLQALQAADAPLFFGRERDLAQCLQRLGDSSPPRPGTTLGRWAPQGKYQRWLSIEGGSGSGKSSLLRAGLLPMVQAGVLSARTGLHEWVQVGPLMPGSDPLRALAEALAQALQPEPQRDSHALRQRLQDPHHPEALQMWLADRLADHPQRGVLLAIDQFEELFTQCPPEQRQHLDALLAQALSAPQRQLHLVSTCRSDYAHRIVEDLPQLARLRQDEGGAWPIAPMSPNEMRRAIQGPARLCGVDVSEVIAALLQDARDDMAGALPLMQQCLSTLYAQEARTQAPVRRISLPTYEAEGRLVGVLARQADAVLTGLRGQSAQHEKGALELLLALAHWQPDGRHTRQHLPLVAARRQAGLGNVQRGEAVLNTLAAPGDGTIRLVVISDEQAQARVDLIHEALLRSRPGHPPSPYWKTLLDYLEQHRDRQHLRDGLRLQAEAWQQLGGGRKGTASYAELRRFTPLRPLANELEQRFLKASYWPARLSILVIAVATFGLLAPFTIFPLAARQEMSRQVAANPIIVQAMNWLQPVPIENLLPQAVEIPLGLFDYGCRIGRDGTVCPSDENVSGTQAKVDMAALPGVCTAFAATEITFAQYDYYVHSVRGANSSMVTGALPKYPHGAGWGWQRGQHPVVNVTWRDAVAYAHWLSQVTHQKWRLPTEAEWEYAARAEHPQRPGGKAGPYWWGSESPKTKRTENGQAIANCKNCGPDVGQGLMAVASFEPNPFGLYDTVGNVWEWTASVYNLENKAAPFSEANDRINNRVVRGGSWGGSRFGSRGDNREPSIGTILDTVKLQFNVLVGASFRGSYPIGAYSDALGFRVCRASPIEPPVTGAAGH